MMGCGNYFGIIFMSLFVVIFFITAINLFIAFIIDGFKNVKEEENLHINNEILENFIDTWKEFD
jgi:hypothetical protein